MSAKYVHPIPQKHVLRNMCSYTVGCCVAYLCWTAMREAYVWDKSIQHPTFCIQKTMTKHCPGMWQTKPHQMDSIGKLIKEELEQQERSVTWLARKLSCDRSNVYRLFQKRSIETDLLIRISVILNRDFAIEISKAIQEKYQSQYSQQKWVISATAK